MVDPLRSADTTPEAFRVQMDTLRALGPARRLEMALQLSATVRELLVAGIRRRHPEYDDEEVRLAALRATLDAETYDRFFDRIVSP